MYGLGLIVGSTLLAAALITLIERIDCKKDFIAVGGMILVLIIAVTEIM